jgi:hypothetical protein
VDGGLYGRKRPELDGDSGFIVTPSTVEADEDALCGRRRPELELDDDGSGLIVTLPTVDVDDALRVEGRVEIDDAALC